MKRWVVLAALLGIVLWGYQLRLGIEMVIRGPNDPLMQSVQRLTLENQSLRTEIVLLQKGLAPSAPKGLIRVPRNVDYSFNGKSIMTLGRGSDDGMTVGGVVLAAPQIFFGKITKVEKRWSLIETIFDDHYVAAVRIGKNGVPALLQGGRQPMVTMIGRARAIVEGDIVYAADRDLPYGLKLGEIGGMSEEATRAFKKSALRVPYTIGELEALFVMQ
jgi:hypothetical protein